MEPQMLLLLQPAQAKANNADSISTSSSLP